jgi:hypothetical protein
VGVGHQRAREVRRQGWIVPLTLGLLLLGGTFLYREQLEERAAVDDELVRFGGLGRMKSPQRVGPVTLDGPDGPITFPTGGPCVVHVWREGCEDCAQAFEFAEKLEVGGDRWGVPVHNVAFGPSRLDVARSRGLDRGLVYDPVGTAIVRPLGIGTFTTLVLDAQGNVRLRDHPQMDGYEARVREAVAAVDRQRTSASERALAFSQEPPPRNTIALDLPIAVPLAGTGVVLCLVGFGWGLATVDWAARRRRAGPAPLRKLGQELDLQAGQRCPYCHAGVGGFDWCVRCDGCGATYHEECGRDLGVCSALGCGRVVGTAT